MELKDIKGVGPKVFEKLKEKGITDVKSLIYTFPINYIDYHLSGFSYYDKFNVKAVISTPLTVEKFTKTKRISFKILIEGLEFNAVAFNMEYISKTFKMMDECVICGEYNREYKQIVVGRIFHIKDYKEGIIPEYNIDGVNNPLFNKIVNEALKEYKEKEIIIPISYFDKYGYKTGLSLLNDIHNPKTSKDYKKAIEAIKYYELLSFSIKLSLIRENVKELKKENKICKIDLIKEFINNSIDFELTIDQKNAVNEIFKYFVSDTYMNVLLEGDVGCGKTIVSIISSYSVYTAGYQSLVIAPTESLAIQHYNTYKKYLDKYNVKIELLTSSVSKKNRAIIIDRLKNNDIDIIIGTHSLLNDEIKFNNLGFVVCDEQHKFGVEQRKILKEKGKNVDVLYMSATPIPRTLALTIYSDMDLIRINSRPSLRGTVRTYIHTYKDYSKVLDFVKEEVKEKRQAYFVASRIDEDNESDLVSVNRIKEDILKYNPLFKVGLLHGRMDDLEKVKVLDDFKNRVYDILVSTSVIEVGIDNSNASVMVVIDAYRFGLSQLHQLRGRVGRGENDGYCFLMVDRLEYFERLNILKETNDGFKISEQDLIDRGPGDFVGFKQSGMLKFNYANIIKDKELFSIALKDSKELIKNDKVKEYYTSKLSSLEFN